MPNPDHVDLVIKGAAELAEWRARETQGQLDLTEANLRYVNLHGADLSGARLGYRYEGAMDPVSKEYERSTLPGLKAQGADLRNAGLIEANLTRAHLMGADLRDADLAQAYLREAKLSNAKLAGARLKHADLEGADLRGADLRGADLSEVDLNGANLSNADLSTADLRGADLSEVDLNGANLSNADLSRATLVETQLAAATLTGARVYGASVWDVHTDEETEQTGLIITPDDEDDVMVDNLEVAQFVYLILNNPKIREVINTIGERGVLILGRFSERKHVLEAIRDEVRKNDLIPIVFDFKRPTNLDFSETVLTLAGMSRFVIADITKPQSVPHELELTVPNFMIPFVPLIQKPDKPYAMFEDLWRKHGEWVLNPLSYSSVEQLLRVFETKVIERANTRRIALIKKKAEKLVVLDADENEG